MANTILAADLGKFNSVLCWYEPETRSTAFRTVRTCEEELRRELTRPVVQVVFEACSQAGWVHDLCEELKLAPLVASTTGAAWQWKRVKRKTDRDDAFKLARLAAVGEIDCVPVLPWAGLDPRCGPTTEPKLNCNRCGDAGTTRTHAGLDSRGGPPNDAVTLRGSSSPI